jgi:signal transduction histidine kinase
MYNLLENLLFIARTDQNRQKLKKQNLELSEILGDVMKKMILVAKNHNVQLLQNDLAQVYGDETTIRQMIRIFLDNATKYTPTGGNISVQSVKKGGKVHLSISDTGIGIAPENLYKVFDRFFRIDSEELVDAAKGSGLGLSIAKWIADNHGVKIEVASELGKGTTFTLIIPTV